MPRPAWAGSGRTKPKPIAMQIQPPTDQAVASGADLRFHAVEARSWAHCISFWNGIVRFYFGNSLHASSSGFGTSLSRVTDAV